MAERRIAPNNYAKALTGVSAGDEIVVWEGTYTRPLVIDGAVGTATQPIVIRPQKSGEDRPTFRSSIKQDEARLWANRAADQRQRAGYYPSFGHLGDQAMLILRRCQYVIIRNLDFEGCWPTAIYLDSCQFVAINQVCFKSGTIAIGANGIDTHDIIVQDCHWQQDITGCYMWHRVPWGRIHGSSDNSVHGDVDLKGDYRHWDGDFFRAWNISGNVIIRGNCIKDAFNAIHFFNTFDRLAPGVEPDGLVFNGGRQSASNILIEDNHFTRIRDNVFEPEEHAWNWVIRRNHLHDCYRPFSFELERAGWIYVYGNTASFVNKPSGCMSEDDQQKFENEFRQTFTLFKPGGRQANEGPIYLLNNSWYMASGKGILPNHALGKLVHANNAIQFEPEAARMFGKAGTEPTHQPYNLAIELISEEQRFTRRWQEFGIRMNGDLASDANFPNGYRVLGYDIGAASRQGSPNFANPEADECNCGHADENKSNFKPNSKMTHRTAIDIELELPDGFVRHVPGGHDIGAVQSRPSAFEKIEKHFRFLPCDEWFQQHLN